MQDIFAHPMIALCSLVSSTSSQYQTCIDLSIVTGVTVLAFGSFIFGIPLFFYFSLTGKLPKK